MATLKYKDENGNYQPIVGLNVQNQVVQTTGQSTTAVMSQKAVSDLVPAQASSSNQLADKNFVNSSISTATATYQGSYNLVSDLSLTIQASHGQIEDALGTAISGADNNDYAFVQIPTADATPTEIASVERYKFNGTRWSYEYAINNSGFTAAQWAAVNSGITSGLVAKINDLTSNPQNSIAALFGMDASGNFQNISTTNLASVLSAAGADGMNDRFVHHDLVIDDDMTYGTGNHQLYGFSGQDAVIAIYDGVSSGSRQFKFTQGGDILTRSRRDWVTWNAWTSITPKVSVFFSSLSETDPWYPNQGASGLAFTDPNSGNTIYIAFPSGGGTQMAIKNGNGNWRVI